LEEYANGNAGYEHGKPLRFLVFVVILRLTSPCLCVYRSGKFEIKTAGFDVVSGRGTSLGKTVVQSEQTRTTRHDQGMYVRLANYPVRGGSV